MSYYKKTVIIVGFATMPMIANALSYEVGVELANTNLNRNNLAWYGPFDQALGSLTGGDLESIEPSSDQKLTLDVALDLGNNWTVSLRTSSVDFSESDSVTTAFELSAARPSNGFFAGLGFGGWDSGTAKYELEETSIDVELAYSLSFGANGQGSFSPLFGFRTLSNEQAFDTLYNDTTSTDLISVSESIESDGMGFFAGAEVTWKYNEFIGFEGRVEVGTLQVDTSRENIEISDGGAPSEAVEVSVEDSISESATITAASLGVSVQAYDNDTVNLVAHIGYEISTTNGLSDFINFPGYSEGINTTGNLQSLGYDGIYLGLTGTF